MDAVASLPVTLRPLPLTPDGIADLAWGTLVDAVGGWSMGVQGALAEFVPCQARVDVRRQGRTVEAQTEGGGLRLAIPEAAQAFAAGDPYRPDGTAAVYVAVPRASLPAPPAGVTILGPDRESLRRPDGGGVLVDLAIGHASAAFCVRTGDGDLVTRLRAVTGATWREALETAGPAVVAASPHRVVITSLGRVEVWGPIPPEQGTSPDGPHTHLLPALLATGRELPAGHALPPDFAPAAAFHPAPGWCLSR